MKTIRLIFTAAILISASVAFAKANEAKNADPIPWEYTSNSVQQQDIDNPDNYQKKVGSGDYSCGLTPVVCTIMAEENSATHKPTRLPGTHFDDSQYSPSFRDAQ